MLGTLEPNYSGEELQLLEILAVQPCLEAQKTGFYLKPKMRVMLCRILMFRIYHTIIESPILYIPYHTTTDSTVKYHPLQ